MASVTDTSCLDHTLCGQMEKYIEELTTSGQTQLDEVILKKLKHICKRSDGYVTHAFHVLMIQLHKGHAEIRSATCQLIDQLFCRSHCFRELLLDVFQDFIELTLETDPNKPLPPPRPVARKLIVSVQETVKKWNVKFGPSYRKLALGYDYLVNCRKMSFSGSSGQTVAEREQQRERERRLEVIRQDRLNGVLQEMNDVCVEIDSCLKEIDGCLELLLPIPANFNPAVGDQSLTQTDSCQSDSHQCTQDTPNLDHLASSTQQHSNNSCSRHVSSDIDEIESKSRNLETLQNKTLTTECQKREGLELNETQPKPSTSYQISHEENEEGEEEEDLAEDVDSEDEVDLRQHGVTDWRYSLEIKLNSDIIELIESDDNADIFKTLWDMVRLIRKKFQPTITRWLEVLTKNSGDGSHIKRVLDKRRALITTVQKVERLSVVRMDGTRNTGIGDKDSDCESDFEDVPLKEGYEADVIGVRNVPQEVRHKMAARTSEEWQLSGSGEVDNTEFDPTSMSANLMKKLQSGKLIASATKVECTSRPSTSTTSSAALHSKAPVVPYSTDLLHWGEKMETPMRVRFDADHRFWNAQESEESVDKSALEALTKRRITFAGRFVPVNWKCRAPLGEKGKLCERMDRFKCPFHGKVIGRDKDGCPTNEEDIKRMAEIQAENERRRTQEWDDVELQRDIEAATGVSLVRKRGGKGKGRSKNQHPNLTDLKKQTNTSRNRLEAKIFQRKAMKRVAEALNSIDSKRFKDKFGNSFNYAYNS